MVLAALFGLVLLLELHPALSGAAGAARLAFMAVAPGWLLLPAVGLGGRADRDPAATGEVWARRTLYALLLSSLPFAVATFALVRALGTTLEAAAWAAFVATGAAAVARAAWRLRRRRARADGTRPTSARRAWQHAALLLAPPLLLAVAAGWLLEPVGVRYSYHGALHAGLVAQLHAGVVPPDHLALADVPIDFYWFFHWLLASQVALSGLSVLVCAPLGALVSLGVYVGAASLLLARFLPPGRAAWAALAAAFAVNLFFPLLFAVGFARGGLPAQPVFWPFAVLEAGVPGGDPRIATLLAKFLNLNGFPLGLAAWAALLDLLVPGARGKRPGAGAGVFLALCHAILFHTTTALAAYPALALAVWASHLRGLGPRAGWDAAAASAAPALPFVAALAATAPYLVGVSVGSPNLEAMTSARHAPDLSYDLAGILLSATPLVLAFAWGVARTPRQDASEAIRRFLLVTTGVLLLLAAVVPLPDHNEYKIVLLASLPGGALLFALLAAEPHSTTPAARGLFAGFALLGVAAACITLFAYRVSPISYRRDVGAQGFYVTLPLDPERERTFRWLREETPWDAIVVAHPEPVGRSRVRAVSGRAVFLLDGGAHVQGSAEVGARSETLRRLFAQDFPLDLAAMRLAQHSSRPLYVLVLREDEDAAGLRARFDSGGDFRAVLRSEDATVYRLERRRPAARTPGVD